MSAEIQDALRSEARKLLEEGKVDKILGYCMSGDRVVPCMVYAADEVDKLIYNNRCKINLARYLRECDGRVGVVAKGCDSRAIVELLKAKQLDRSDLFIWGVSCPGMVDSEGRQYRSCSVCTHRNPVVYDGFLGKLVEEKPRLKDDELGLGSRDERMSYWSKQFSRCISCMACRNVCPMCYCKECVLEKKDPEWVARGGDISDIFVYHAIKAMHMAGRCVECGECERACPVDIPLMHLYSRVCRDVEQLFGVEAGMDENDKPPLSVFDLEADAILEENEKNKKS
ncbi:MAG: hypothetical protein B6U97_03340 [Candidatus Altiarchaeales archaeon ex4484_96]|nr:MAG: hypothetical protein B6U97_03340 [Candidatus Altiarchaeales archaeon ex4484_96]